jgi:hypothetical protein
MKPSIISLAFGLTFPTVGLSYVVDGGDSLGWKAVHKDDYRITFTPGVGESISPVLIGYDNNCFAHITVVPESGERASGTVRALFCYEAKELLSLTFNNYQSTPFDYHYGFRLDVREDNNGPLVAAYNLSSIGNEIVVDLNIGVPLQLDFVVDAAEIHDSHLNWRWRPLVTDTTVSGVALALAGGELSPISIQVVPEPSGLSLCAMGLILAGWSSMKPRT